MPTSRDDLSVGPDKNLLRVLWPKWSTTKGGRERPTSDSLLDSNFENSCFVEGEISVEDVQRLFPGLKVARIPVWLAREQEFAVERRPEEAPEQCPVRDSHVVVGPLAAIDRGEYEKRARAIVKSAAVEIILPPHNV